MLHLLSVSLFISTLRPQRPRTKGITLYYCFRALCALVPEKPVRSTSLAISLRATIPSSSSAAASSLRPHYLLTFVFGSNANHISFNRLTAARGGETRRSTHTQNKKKRTTRPPVCLGILKIRELSQEKKEKSWITSTHLNRSYFKAADRPCPALGIPLLFATFNGTVQRGLHSLKWICRAPEPATRPANRTWPSAPPQRGSVFQKVIVHTALWKGNQNRGQRC